MSRMMKALRKIHINQDTWKYYLRGQRGNLIIFAPSGKRHEISLEEFIKFIGGDPDYEVDNISYTILPSNVKAYIEKKILTSSETELSNGL